MKHKKKPTFKAQYKAYLKRKNRPPKPSPKTRVNQNLDNFFKHIMPIENEWGLPAIKPCNVNMDGVTWFNFNEKEKITDPENTAIHMFVEDYQFNIVWTQPDKYLELFKKCRAVVLPDFSCYTDMSKAQQMWSAYKRQWCGRYWQDHGVNVIASLSWALGQMHDWIFDGIPQDTVCAVSFVCDRADNRQHIKELKEAVNRVKPSRLYIKASNKDCIELRKHFEFEQIPPFVYISRR